MKKTLPNFGHCPNRGGGGQQRSQTFYRKKVWTRGEGGQRASSKVVFTKKYVSCILDLWTVFFLFFKLIFILQNIWTWISHTNPSPIRKIPLFDLSEIDLVISNFLCQNVQTTVRGGGFPNQVWASKRFASIPAWEGGGSRGFGQCPKFLSFFGRLPLLY